MPEGLVQFAQCANGQEGADAEPARKEAELPGRDFWTREVQAESSRPVVELGGAHPQAFWALRGADPLPRATHRSQESGGWQGPCATDAGGGRSARSPTGALSPAAEGVQLGRPSDHGASGSPSVVKRLRARAFMQSFLCMNKMSLYFIRKCEAEDGKEHICLKCLQVKTWEWLSSLVNTGVRSWIRQQKTPQELPRSHKATSVPSPSCAVTLSYVSPPVVVLNHRSRRLVNSFVCRILVYRDVRFRILPQGKLEKSH